MYISANKLKELRRLRGFSQEELAEAADVSLATLQSWEQGKRVPHDIYIFVMLWVCQLTIYFMKNLIIQMLYIILISVTPMMKD